MIALSEGLGPHGENLSVMIPTYNCASYLVETLDALRASTKDVSRAQVEVVDDCSTKDDPAEVAARYPGVTFFRQPKNGGPAANFNSCVARAEREWVHICHGDDFVLPGYYADADRLLSSQPTAEAFFGRSVVVDKLGVWQSLMPQIGPAPGGLLVYDPALWRSCLIQFSSVMVCHSTYLKIGNFRTDFSHVLDAEMWWRLARRVPCVYSTQVGAAYRLFAENHSSSLYASAANIKEGARLINELYAETRQRLGDECPPRSFFYEPLFTGGALQAARMRHSRRALIDNLRATARLPATLRTRVQLLRVLAKAIID